MIELSPESAARYLASRGGVPRGPWRIAPLGGGVSNVVLLVECETARFVIKQALAKLRVKEDWFADRGRIHRECSALRALEPRLPSGALPRILFEDRENYLYAMQAASAGASDWKALLLGGVILESTASAAARILTAQVAASFQDARAAREFGDQTCFDQLRLDPYYRFTAARHPDLAERFHGRIEAARRNACALVHGDFSPKNFLVDGEAVTLIDFEVIHYGDPAFDAGFLLNHLLLKAIHRPEWAGRYARAALAFWRGLSVPIGRFEIETIAHLGCLLLARVDGKSPAEYLSETSRSRARQLARALILDPPDTVEEVFRQACP